MKKKSVMLCLFLASAIIINCSGGGGGGSKAAWRTSSTISAKQFVDALNEVDGLQYAQFKSLIEKDVWDTLRTYDDYGLWFVIWDEDAFEHRAVNLDYLRTIEYYAYYTSYWETAYGYRVDEIHGTHYTNEQESVQYVGVDHYGLPLYYGAASGFYYGEETVSYDVSLSQKDARDIKNAERISKISSHLKIGAKAAAAVALLGVQARNMLEKGNGSLTEDDQNALAGTLENFFDRNIGEVTEIIAMGSKEEQDKLFEDLAYKMESNAANFRQNVLGKFFGIEI